VSSRRQCFTRNARPKRRRPARDREPMISRLRLFVLASASAFVVLVGAAGTARAATATTTTLYVTTSGTDTANTTCAQSNPCATVAHALSEAVGGDTISIGPGSFAGEATVTANVTIQGAGANETTLTGGAPDQPILTTAAGTSVGVQDLALAPTDVGEDGVLASAGTLRLVGVSITSSGSTEMPANGVAALPGAGTIQLSVVDSTLADAAQNGIAVGSSSGGNSTVSVINSTIADNNGDGILDPHSDQITLEEDTISGNSVGLGALTATAALTDTLLAGNSQADCRANSIVDGGNNLIGVDNASGSSICTTLAGVDGNVVGTSANPVDPKLGPLADNGGPTETMALLTGSPAISAGNATACEATPVDDLDQRGDPRNALTRGTCDIGAYDTGGAGAPTLPLGSVGGLGVAAVVGGGLLLAQSRRGRRRRAAITT